MGDNTAKKLDTGKPRFDLVPGESLIEVVMVYTMGAEKYEAHNWRKGMLWSRVFAAIMRHLWAFWMGEDLDKESGLPHLAHAAWGCLTLISYLKTVNGEDDRVKVETVERKAATIHCETCKNNQGMNPACIMCEDYSGWAPKDGAE